MYAVPDPAPADCCQLPGLCLHHLVLGDVLDSLNTEIRTILTIFHYILIEVYRDKKHLVMQENWATGRKKWELQTECKQAEFTQEKFKLAELRQAKFKQAELRQTEVNQAELRQTEFNQAELRQVELRVKQAEYKQAELGQAKF